MNVQKLKQQLFGERTRVYAALDGASVPDLPIKLHEMRPRHVCLYRGELEPDLAWVAPYLVQLMPETAFTDWLLTEGWGKHWGIFAHSMMKMPEMRKHFRSLLTVHDEKGSPMLFRFYDPRVLSWFLPTCKSDELEKVFGKTTKYFTENEETNNLSVFRLENGQLQKSEVELEAKQ